MLIVAYIVVLLVRRKQKVLEFRLKLNDIITNNDVWMECHRYWDIASYDEMLYKPWRSFSSFYKDTPLYEYAKQAEFACKLNER